MPNVMVVLRKVAPSVQRRKVWLTPTAGVLACDGRTDRRAVKIKKDVELEFFLQRAAMLALQALY